ncbi:MAG: MFS transporter, partial [Kiloniellales bacterium]
AIPMFLFTPDADRSRVPVLHAFKDGVMQLWSMVKRLKDHRDAAIFLGSRMLYVDGMTAILFFAGVYAAGVMKWGALEMLAYGVSLSVFAVAGGFIGGALDHWLGPKRAVQIELLVTLVGIAGMLGMAPDRIFYFWAYDASAHPPLWNGPLFRTLPEALYIFIGFFNAIFITAQYASSRTLLTRLTPPDQTGVFFGLYALSGTVTLFLGSTLVHVATEVFHSQQIGFSMTALLLALGFIGLSFVRGGGREA